LERPFINADDSLYGKVSPVPVFPNDVDINQRFCYTVSYGGDRPPDAAQLLLRDLESYFELKATIETRLTPCWVVTITKENAEKLRSRFPKFNGELDFAGFEFHRTTLKKLIRNVASMDKDETLPYINETGIDFPIDLKIEAPLSEREMLFAALQEKGIVITLELRPMKVMVLKHEKGVAAIACHNT
jgi:hypothetical protein